jgi:hypothetical protein
MARSGRPCHAARRGPCPGPPAAPWAGPHPVRYRPTRWRKVPWRLGFRAPRPVGRLVAGVHSRPGMSRLRLVLAAAVLPLLSACTAVIPVDVTRQLALDSPGGAFSTSEVVDLTQEGAVWSRRNSVDAVSIDDITATVVSVEPGSQAATVSLELVLRPAGASDASHDLHVGALSGLSLVAGASATLHGSAALDDFLLGVLKGSGQFTALVSGSLAGPASAVIEITLKGSASVKVVGT